jgi:hypothetical protein
VCALWGRSVVRSDAVGWAGWRDERAADWRGYGARAYRHRLLVYAFDGNIRFLDPTEMGGANDADPRAFRSVRAARTLSLPADTDSVGAAGFQYRQVAVPAFPPFRTSLRLVTLPFWALAAAFAVPPAIAFRRRWRTHCAARQQRRAGLCPTCGYDLRATPDRCPECGAAGTMAASP